jgi:hypothetical protein
MIGPIFFITGRGKSNPDQWPKAGVGSFPKESGEIADDKFLHGINFYVQGVLGKVPSGS